MAITTILVFETNIAIVMVLTIKTIKVMIVIKAFLILN